MQKRTPRILAALACGVAVSLFLFHVIAAEPEYELNQPVSVTVAGQTMQLPTGQAVSLLGSPNGNGDVMIRVVLADGSLSIAQVPMSSLRQKTAGVAAVPPPAAVPPAAAMPPPAPATAASTPPPAATPVPFVPQASAPAPAAPAPSTDRSSQFAVIQGSSSGATGDGSIHKDWKLVWEDDFSKDSKIDLTKWNYEIDGKGEGNGEMEYYTNDPKNSHIENGALVITARKDDGGHKFTSARMTTKGKFSWLYGRFEAMIKFPKGQGYWPAFWMMPEDSKYGGWASSGELDIVEVIGQTPKLFYGTIHYGDKWPKNVHTGDKFTLQSGDVSTDFHLISVEWEKGVIRWYIDNKLYQTQTKWYTKAAPFPAPFDQKFYIILNLAVGGAWPHAPDKTTVFPGSMIVKFVRVYQP